jgi:hypothetical protein
VTVPALTGMLTQLAGVWRLAGHLLLAPSGKPTTDAALLAAVLLVGVFAACVAGGAAPGRVMLAAPLSSRAAALRTKSWRAAFLPQCDPDAAGRPRPRAPSAALAAALR